MKRNSSATLRSKASRRRERVADEAMKPGAVGEDGADDRAVGILELGRCVDERTAAKAGFEELRGDVVPDIALATGGVRIVFAEIEESRGGRAYPTIEAAVHPSS